MKDSFNRRSFMKIAGSTLGVGVLYTALPVPAVGEAGEMMRWLGKNNGEEAICPIKRCPRGLQRSSRSVGHQGVRAGRRDDQCPAIAARTGPLHRDLTHNSEEKTSTRRAIVQGQVRPTTRSGRSSITSAIFLRKGASESRPYTTATDSTDAFCPLLTLLST
jgi:hypothetical protein